MALKDYDYNWHKCIIINHSEFVELLKWFLKHGAEDYKGRDIPMFENIYDILDDLDVKYEDFTCTSKNEEDIYLIKDVSELELFLLKNINEQTLVPSNDEYPIIVNWYGEDSFDNWGRLSKNKTKILTFTSLSTVKHLKEYINDFKKVNN